jgi:hypothetical protein
VRPLKSYEFNWGEIQLFSTPYPHIICDNFILDYGDEIFPTDVWCEENLHRRENDVTKSLGAYYTLESEDVHKSTIDFIQSATGVEFHNKVCDLFNIHELKDVGMDIRRTPGDYRVARECMPTVNTYSEEPILEVHHDHPVTIWTGLIYFSDSDHGAFNIHNQDQSLHKKVPIRKNRLILTLGSPSALHSVDSWPLPELRKYFYLTSEFKNSGRDKEGNAIGATEFWFPPN